MTISLFISFRQDVSNHKITLMNIKGKKKQVDTNIEDVFSCDATRNHRAFTWGLVITGLLLRLKNLILRI